MKSTKKNGMTIKLKYFISLIRMNFGIKKNMTIVKNKKFRKIKKLKLLEILKIFLNN